LKRHTPPRLIRPNETLGMNDRRWPVDAIWLQSRARVGTFRTAIQAKSVALVRVQLGSDAPEITSFEPGHRAVFARGARDEDDVSSFGVRRPELKNRLTVCVCESATTWQRMGCGRFHRAAGRNASGHNSPNVQGAAATLVAVHTADSNVDPCRARFLRVS
jgi:hypothetical protein